jgi:hypothetical protein
MYSITEIIFIQLFCFIIVINSKSIINLIQKKIPFFNAHNLNELINFYKFICDNNPLLLDYLDTSDIDVSEETIKEENNNNIEIEEKFEDKYLTKFKSFPNEFSFSELELQNEKKEFEKIKIEFEQNRSNSMIELQQELTIIEDIIETGNFRKLKNENECYTDNINTIGVQKLLKFCDINSDDEDEEDYEVMYLSLLEKRDMDLKKMNELENMTLSDEEISKQARDIIINKKLDKYIDNYVLEYTPIGNIYMRYNNEKKSFEYFSNNSMPYRFLEPVGRKYVMTYWCKPLFIDIEEELKKAEEKFDEEKKKKEEEDKIREEESKKNPKKVLAQLKSYNKETKDQTMKFMKNRSNINTVLPPQIKANLPIVNNVSEKQLLKENANRYTWEGRLTNFCPLKKIDRKILDKKLSMTYADFKKMQQEQQNKK